VIACSRRTRWSRAANGSGQSVDTRSVVNSWMGPLLSGAVKTLATNTQCPMPARTIGKTSSNFILGYSFTGADPKWVPADYDYAEVTHITRCFLMFQEDGRMTDGGIFLGARGSAVRTWYGQALFASGQYLLC
jgi:hypothetical protein